MDDSEMDEVENEKCQHAPMMIRPTGEMLTCRRSDSMPDQRDEYDFSHDRRGIAIVINNEDFYSSTGQKKRTGSSLDTESIVATLRDHLHFDVQQHDNLTAKQIMKTFYIASRQNHRNADCFACVILTHGEETLSSIPGRYDARDRNDVIYGTDETLNTKDILAFFTEQSCPSLAGKPKLFFIQACRGTLLDAGVNVPADQGDDVVDASIDTDTIHTVPIYEDFLLMYATPPGYFAFRRQTTGSWFIQALCEVLRSGKNRNLMRALTRVNSFVARNYESSTKNPDFDKKKQVPCIYSKLTRDVLFMPKGFKM